MQNCATVPIRLLSGSWYVKTILVMKLTAFLIFAFCIQANAKVFSQEVNFSGKNVPLKRIFQAVEKQTGFVFFYRASALKDTRPVTVNVKNFKLNEFLNIVFQDQPVQFSVENNGIIVSRKPPLPVAPAFAPLVDIRGRILNEEGDPVAGATVYIKGSNIGTSTDENGGFLLRATGNRAVLIISSVGYETQEVSVSGSDPVLINLKRKDDTIDDIVVIGYGTQKKVDVTGAISVVTAEEVNQGVNQSVLHALQGRASGVTILQNAGDPGGSVAVRIRGAGTLNDNNPLYVIDGVIGSIGGLNPADIESISILKDAASAAIYGTRAANGVVIVTTKKGKRDQPTQISFTTSNGVQQPWKMPKALTAEQMVMIHKEALENDGTPPTESIWDFYNNPDNAVTRTDWFKEVFQTAYTSFSDLSVSGGSRRSNYSLSLGVLNSDGIVVGSKFKRYNVRFNSQHEIVKNLVFGENIAISVEDQKSVTTRPAWDGILSAALFNHRSTPVYQNEEEQVYGTPSGNFPNPVASINSKDNLRRTANIGGNVYLEYKFLKHFTAKTDYAYSYGITKNKDFIAIAKNGGVGLDVNSLVERFSTNTVWIWNNTLNFNYATGKHDIAALIGTSAESGISEGVSSGTARNFSSQDEALRYLSNATSFLTNPSGSADDYTLNGYFGRVSYAYGGRYLFAANVRRDGSSRFSPARRWGVFPSVSAGWRVSEEKFFEGLRHVVSRLKIRGSWGKLGNDKINNYQYYSTVSTVTTPYLNGAMFTAVAQNKLANPNIHWEQTTQADIGIDVELLQNKLQLTVDYFDKKTTDILAKLPLLSSLGVGDAPFQNAGTVSNKGFEATVGFRNRHEKLSYDIVANFSQVKNKLISFGIDGASDIYVSDYKNQNIGRFAEGAPLGHFFVLNNLGVFQTVEEVNNYVDKDGNKIQPNAVPGDLKFEDVNGDGTINSADRINAGSSFPSFSYSLSGSLAYGNFDLNMMWTGTEGNKIFNGYTLGGKLMQGTAYNNSPEILDRWTPASGGTTVPRVTVRDLNNNRTYSTFYIQDGSYVRLKYLTLGYSFDNSMLGRSISNLRLSLTCQNLLTFTGYTGYDPEVGADTDYNSNMYGVDRGVYPQAKSFILGIHITL